jgi:hypothetical protein
LEDKVKLVPVKALKAYWGSGVELQSFIALELDADVVNFTAWLLNAWGTGLPYR